MDFTYLIMQWYGKNMRDLPWRRTTDPYSIWVSEVILQQTRVGQGLSYYQRFLERFPDIETLAMAEEEDVMKVWQGLGYYTRARNMHHSARVIVRDNHARFPASYDELRKMKGVGDYSASAISSIANGEKQPVVDGNVLRVIARYLGIEEPVNTTVVRKKVKEFLFKHISPDEPGNFNQAMMELGALVCRPKQPICINCPVRESCFALAANRTDDLPVVNRAKPLRTRHFHYLVITSGKGNEKFTWLHKRTGNDIWKNLYDFPLIEAERELGPDEIMEREEFRMIFKDVSYTVEPAISKARHILSHQELKVIIVQVLADLGDILVQVLTDLGESKTYIKVPISEVHKYPVPRLIENYLKKIEW
jgi:A/G-specific adenine glycosylase